MTQEGRVDEFWTTRQHGRTTDDNVRPLLKALAAARRSLGDEHYSSEADAPDAVVVDIRPEHPTIEERPESPPSVETGPDTGARARRAHPASGAPDWIMVEAPQEETARPAPDWGDLWRASVQGWVRSEEGTKIWRPIVTTTTSVPNWEIDTNLGMVTGESACALDASKLGVLLETRSGVESLRRELADDRAVGETAMVEEAVARGAHAVIGVKLDYTPLRDCLIVTATGTAVTLRSPR